MDNPHFRPVNRAVGMSPKLGAFSLYQLVPLAAIAMGSWYLRALLDFSWITTALVWGTFSGTTLALLGDKPWLFYSRNMKVPTLVRFGLPYNPWLPPPKKRSKTKGHPHSRRG